MLAEAATAHPDGTISMLRAGITRIRGRKKPIIFRGCLVVGVEAEMSETGPHQVDVQCLDVDGKRVLPTLTAQMVVAAGGAKSYLILGLNVRFQEFGEYQFSVNVNRSELDTWSLKVAQVEAPDGTDKPNDPKPE